jgi:hypothetical protein
MEIGFSFLGSLLDFEEKLVENLKFKSENYFIFLAHWPEREGKES